MRTLDRKLIRELGESKSQAAAIALVIASGVAVFVMSLSTLGFLQNSRDAYYDRYRFGDLFATLRRAPSAVSERIGEIPGVGLVQTRIVSEVTLDVPGLAEPAVGRLISLPEHGPPKLNAVHLRRGQWPATEPAGEVLASEAFVEANGLEVGATIEAVLYGRLQTLRIVGVAISPEYVFQMRGGDILPDDRRFAVLWMPERQMEAAFDLDGAFNSVSLRLLREANSDEVIARLDDLLQPYGGVGAIDRTQQVSARFLDDEIKQLRATGLVAPAIFLAVAAFLLNIVLSRRIMTQRVVIAALKSFGYTNTEVAWHYLKSSLLVAIAGAIAGVAVGQWMGRGLADLYASFYRFPALVDAADPGVVVLAVAVSISAACLGSYRAVADVVRMPPAEAMRPAAPAVYRRSILDRLALAALMPVAGRMVLRNLQRRPLSALFSIVGIGFSVSILVLTGFSSDALDYLIDFQFSRAQRHDVQVGFHEVTSPSARYDLAHLPGVQAVEAFRAVPVTLRFGHRPYRTSILGLPDRRELYRLLDVEGQPIALPPDGLVLNDKLAEILHVGLGQEVTVEVLEGEQPVRQVPVRGIAAEYAGTNAYMRRAALNRLLRETDALSGAFLAVDARYRDTLYRELKRTPQVASVAIRSATVQQFRETVASNQLMMQSFTIFFAAVIAVGVVYNTARISLEERSRELATLRVVGFTRAEVSSILLGELAVLTLAAIPLGWLIGYGFCAAMVYGFESEMYRIPLVIQPASYAWAGLVILVASAASGLWVRRRLDRLDLVEVLKSRE